MQVESSRALTMSRIPTWLLVTVLVQGPILHCNRLYAPATAAANCADVTVCGLEGDEDKTIRLIRRALQGGCVNIVNHSGMFVCATDHVTSGLKDSLLGNRKGQPDFAKSQRML